MKINPHIFRQYDVRGYVDKDLSEEFAYLLGRAYATFAKDHDKNNIAIGFDCRLTSELYAQSFARGLANEGIDSCITGLGPTPQLYYAVNVRAMGGGVQVTGSHNPSDMNGFKLLIGNEALSGEQIQDLRRRCEALLDTSPSAKGSGNITESLIQTQYIAELIENSKKHIGQRKLKVVVDAGNGVAGLVGPKVLRELGVEVIELYCEPDGRFPNHHPDPTVLKNIEELINTVKESKADFGIGWDGDGDRIGVVDENGDVIFGDMLLLIYARAIVAEVPNAKIIADVKTSSLLFDDLQARGAQPLMWMTGHSLIKKKLKEINGELAGEMSGHIMFKHRYYGFDDALYASSRLVEIMSKHNGPISSLISDLPTMFSTPEIRVDCPEEIKFQIPEKAKTNFAQYKVDTIDGARITFDNGWGLIRASNTQPVLVMRFEATSQKYLDQYQKLVTDWLEGEKNRLA